MHARRLLRTALVVVALVVPAACSSSTSKSASTAPTSTAESTAPSTSEATGTTAGGDATTTTKPAATPTTKPAATGAQITMSVSSPAVCPAPDAPYQPPLTIRVSWTVTNADSVTIAIDSPGAYESDLPLTGSMDLSWSCPASAHTYYIQAVKNGQIVAQKTKTVNPPS